MMLGCGGDCPNCGIVPCDVHSGEAARRKERMARGNKLREIKQACKEQGIECETTAAGHMRFYRASASSTAVFASGTPSDWRAERKMLADLRRILGFKWPWTKIDQRNARTVASTAGIDCTLELEKAPKSFAEWFSRLMAAEDITADEVAEVVGVSDRVIRGFADGNIAGVPSSVYERLVDLFPELADGPRPIMVTTEDEQAIEKTTRVASRTQVEPPEPPKVQPPPLPKPKATAAAIEMVLRALSSRNHNIATRICFEVNEAAGSMCCYYEIGALPTVRQHEVHGINIEEAFAPIARAVKKDIVEKKNELERLLAALQEVP